MTWHGFTVSANVSLLFSELPYDQRFRAAVDAGFTAVESWWPFETASPGRDRLDQLTSTIRASGLQLTGLNVFAGDMAGGERGIACSPDRAPELTAGLDALLRVAEATGCRHFNLLHGQLDPRRSAAEQHARAIDAYREAADAVRPLGGTILVEPLASGLNGSYPLLTAADAVALLDDVGAENVQLLLDTFHLGSNGEDMLRVIHEDGERIGHVQLADAPGRGEPGSGDLDLDAIGAALRESGYAGVVGAEYTPTRATELTLDWLERSTT
jgi:hydroxypyruvate isomerase